MTDSERLNEIRERLEMDWPKTMFSGHVKPDMVFLLAELERLQALDEAITYVRSLYPESVFRPDSDSIDARSADMARRTCDNIRRTAEELRAGKER